MGRNTDAILRLDRHRSAELHIAVNDRRDLGRKSDTPVRRWIAWKNSNVETHATPCQAAKVFHRSSDVARAARGGIHLCADARANHATASVHEIAINARAMVCVFLEDGKFTGRRHAGAFTGRDRCIDVELVACEKVKALLGDRDDGPRVLRRDDVLERILDPGGGLSADEILGFAHRLAPKKLRGGIWLKGDEPDKQRGDKARMEAADSHSIGSTELHTDHIAAEQSNYPRAPSHLHLGIRKGLIHWITHAAGAVWQGGVRLGANCAR